MDNLTDQQKHALISHMNRYENDSYEIIASWARINFTVEITAEECFRLFAYSLLNGG